MFTVDVGCVYFYVLDRLIMFTDLGKVVLCPMGPSSTLLWPSKLYSLGRRHVNCVGPSVVVGMTTVGTLVGRTGHQPGSLLGPAHTWAAGQDQVLGWLHAEPEGEGS